MQETKETTIVYDEQLLKDVADGKRYPKSFTQDEWPKLVQAAQVHGYRGPSKKKHNGIVPIPPRDKQLLKVLNKLLRTRLQSGDEEQNHLSKDGTPIKVVAHVPSGNRLIGVRVDNVFHIVGAANYNGNGEVV